GNPRTCAILGPVERESAKISAGVVIESTNRNAVDGSGSSLKRDFTGSGPRLYVVVCPYCRERVHGCSGIDAEHCIEQASNRCEFGSATRRSLPLIPDRTRSTITRVI